MPPDLQKRMSLALADMLRRETELALLGGATTNTTASPPTTLDLHKLIPEWEKTLRNFRRTQVTFVVDRAHEGAPLRHQTPGEGERIELCWLDAVRVHLQWPLRLHQVLSRDAAEFVPASLGQFVPGLLPQPPYEMPEEETLEDWLRGDREP